MGARVVLFTSIKGGSGKSTVCSNLANALAVRGKKTLLISLDKYNTSLDLIFGCESLLFDVSDFPGKDLSEICIDADGRGLIFLCVSMPYSEGNVNVSEILNRAKADDFDFVFIDKGYTSPNEAVELAGMADKVIITSTQADDSLRAAELLGCILYENGIPEEKLSLVLNSFYTDVMSVGYFKGIASIINETKLPLLGIIPFSDEICASQTLAKSNKDGNAGSAFSNLAGRILGEDIKILDFLPQKNRRIILNNECSSGNRI